jgi:chromosome segregation ATPase
LRQTEASSSAAQQQLNQRLAAAQAEVERLKGQLGEVTRLQRQLQGVQGQLQQAGQREAAALAEKAAAQQEATRLAGQVGLGSASVLYLPCMMILG